MSNLSEELVEFYERFSSWENAVVKETDLTLPQTHTLEVLGNNKSLRMKDLAQKLGVVMGTLSVMIKRLEEMGLVQREENPQDKRSAQIVLTERGQEIYQDHHQLHEAYAQEITSGLSAEETRQLAYLLNKMIGSM